MESYQRCPAVRDKLVNQVISETKELSGGKRAAHTESVEWKRKLGKGLYVSLGAQVLQPYHGGFDFNK